MSVEKVKPYDEETAKKEQISNMFDNIAGKYDFLNRFLSLGIDRSWRRKAIAKLKEQAPQKMLDIATGTADLALEAYKQLEPKEIIGVDISNNMLEIGRKKIEKRGLSEFITLEEGDSLNLPFETDSFDAITVAFGVRNFQNVESGLREMVRVLKPGGTCVILEFSRPRVFPLKQSFNLYFKHILPFIGKVTSKDKQAYGYLYESVQAFPEGQDFLDLLTNIGLTNPEQQSLSAGICSIYTGVKPLRLEEATENA